MKAQSYKKIYWLLSCLILAGVPALIIFTSFYRYLFVVEQQFKAELKSELLYARAQSLLNIDPAKFWVDRLKEDYLNMFEQQASLNEVHSWLKTLKNEFAEEFDYLLWSSKGEILDISFASEISHQDWYQVFNTLAANFAFRSQIPYSASCTPNLPVTRKILGAQYLRNAFSLRSHLAWTDSTGKKPLFHNFFFPDCGFLIFLHRDKLARHSALKKGLKEFATAKKLKFGLYEFKNESRPLWLTDQTNAPEMLAKELKDASEDYLASTMVDGKYLLSVYLSPKFRLFVLATPQFSLFKRYLFSALGASLFILLLLPVYKYNYRTIVLQRPSSLSIRWKLAFLFFFASGIPLLILSVFTQENYVQQREDLINKGQKETIDFLVSYDQSFVRRQQQISNDILEFFDSFIVEIKKNSITDENARKAIDFVTQQTDCESFYFIASDTSRLIAKFGNIKLKGPLENSKIDEEQSTMFFPLSATGKTDMTVANLVGKKMLSDLNNTPFPFATLSKLEIMAETVMQRPFIEILHSVLSGFNKMGEWGLGNKRDYAFSRLLKYSDTPNYDYIVMAFWRIENLQTKYLQDSIADANRNQSGIKMFAVSNFDNRKLPQHATLSEALLGFSRTLASRPNENPFIIDYQNEKHLAVGFNASEIDQYRLIALYPLHGIELGIEKQKSELQLFVIFCLLFALGLAQVLFRSFLRPIEALKNGALAIERRDLTHRIALNSKDEFAQIAVIFNSVMEDFEELEVAKIVQEGLFPDPHFSKENFKIYGKSIAMSELGGDYLDFFAIDEQSFAVLLGDVAGHGVGAAVLMAMAKSGICSYRELLKEPAELMMGLHKLILAAKSKKQRKIMTFQYMCVETDGGVHYANAGACSPILLTEMGTKVEELSLAGPALGAFKKAKFSEIAFTLRHGDALIFYTDGIVETRNKQGEEIGYDGFKAILAASYCLEPQSFYNRVFAAYEAHLGDQEAQDDLTFLILICDETIEHSAPGQS